MGREVRLVQNPRRLLLSSAQEPKTTSTVPTGPGSAGADAVRGQGSVQSRAARMLVEMQRRGSGARESQKTRLWLSAGRRRPHRPHGEAGASPSSPETAHRGPSHLGPVPALTALPSEAWLPSTQAPPRRVHVHLHGGHAHALLATALRLLLNGSPCSAMFGRSQSLTLTWPPPGSYPFSARRRGLREHGPVKASASRAGPPPARRCPAAPGQAWTAPLPKPSRWCRPCCRLAWSLTGPPRPRHLAHSCPEPPAASAGSAKPPSQLLRGAGAGRGGRGGAPSPAEPPARL